MRANLSKEDNERLQDLLHNRATIAEALHEARTERDKDKESRLVGMNMSTLIEIWKLWPTYSPPNPAPIVRTYPSQPPRR